MAYVALVAARIVVAVRASKVTELKVAAGAVMATATVGNTRVVVTARVFGCQGSRGFRDSNGCRAVKADGAVVAAGAFKVYYHSFEI